MTAGSIGGIKEQVARIETLGTLPEVMTRIMDLVRDPEANALDLAQEISRDPALTMKLLRLVNSAAYGLQRRIMTVPDAVVVLGFDEVERLALSITVIDCLGLDRDSVRLMRQLWRHSLACSVACSVFELRYVTLMPNLRGAHVAGLLHDIGKAVLMQHFPNVYAEAIQLAETGACNICEAEQEVLDGYTHANVGQWVAERWDLPHPMAEAIGGHHEPDIDAIEEPLAHVTHIVDALCNTFAIHSGPGTSCGDINPKSIAMLPMDDDLAAAVRAQLNRHQNLITAVSTGAMF
ncbi:MAG: HDOD domain-containing protein [Candidatus Hydrogenedentota bacterium]